jgi:hypothetical protein
MQCVARLANIVHRYVTVTYAVYVQGLELQLFDRQGACILVYSEQAILHVSAACL